ncbi:hypothetical protein LZ30DRAFT_826555 [Colletotrichum cereale]|nr:hypothetical protein LZ30DRAFT_826555 [Colletotrichum cereale]
MGRPIKLGVPNVPEDELAQAQNTQPTSDQSQPQTEQATGAGVNTGAAMEEEYAKRDGGS